MLGWLHHSPERDEAEAQKFWRARFREHSYDPRAVPLVAPEPSATTTANSQFLFRFDTCVAVLWSLFAILAATLEWSFTVVAIGIVWAALFAAQAGQQYYRLQRRRDNPGRH